MICSRTPLFFNHYHRHLLLLGILCHQPTVLAQWSSRQALRWGVLFPNTPDLLLLNPPVHNPVWNFETVCFKVENQLFTVIKKDLLVSGSVFVDMFKVPPGPQPLEGKDVDNPIVLHGVKASHFSAFLSELYPWAHGGIKLGNQDEDSLFGVLRLSNMWHFPEIRSEAVRILSDDGWIGAKSNAEKIQLGEEYHVEKWALDGYTQIVRTKALKFGDLEKDPYNFDQTVVKKILYLQAESGIRCGYCGRSSVNRVDNPNVRDLLHDELARTLYVTDDHGSLTG